MMYPAISYFSGHKVKVVTQRYDLLGVQGVLVANFPM